MATSSYITSDPVEVLVREAAAAIREHRQFEMIDRAAEAAALDRLDAIEDTVGHLRATSLLGALYQASLLSGETDENESWAQAKPSAKRMRRLHRMAASIAGVLAEHVDAAEMDTLRGYYPMGQLA